MKPSDYSPFPSSYFEKLAAAESGYWWFRARNRVLLWVLEAKIRPFSSLLEVGCGTGYVLEGISKIYPTATLFGAEYFEEGLFFARQRIPTATFQQLDATAMEDKNRYDVIGAFDVIEHIEHDEKVLCNLGRALKNGGTLMITVPQHRWLWSAVDEHACHLRRYTRAELVEKVARTGLKVDYVSSFVSLLVPVMWLARLNASKDGYEPMSEFSISPLVNKTLEFIMMVELFLLKIGMRFPVGGSLLLIAKKI